MSMLSAQCDELRAMAESVGLAMPQAATLMMEAANTIWELRGSVHRERNEADKLRELVRWMYNRMDESCAGQHCYAPAPIDYDTLMQAHVRAYELGIEVDE